MPQRSCSSLANVKSDDFAIVLLEARISTVLPRLFPTDSIDLSSLFVSVPSGGKRYKNAVRFG